MSLGFGSVASTGIVTPSMIFGLSSTQWTTIDGYLRLNHRKNAGTPIALRYTIAVTQQDVVMNPFRELILMV